MSKRLIHLVFHLVMVFMYNLLETQIVGRYGIMDVSLNKCLCSKLLFTKISRYLTA